MPMNRYGHVTRMLLSVPMKRYLDMHMKRNETTGMIWSCYEDVSFNANEEISRYAY